METGRGRDALQTFPLPLYSHQVLRRKNNPHTLPLSSCIKFLSFHTFFFFFFYTGCFCFTVKEFCFQNKITSAHLFGLFFFFFHQGTFMSRLKHVKHKSIRLNIPPEQVIRTEQRNRWQHSMPQHTYRRQIHTWITEVQHPASLIFLPTFMHEV